MTFMKGLFQINIEQTSMAMAITFTSGKTSGFSVSFSRPQCPSLNIFVHKGSLFKFIAAAAPNKHSLGATTCLA